MTFGIWDDWQVLGGLICLDTLREEPTNKIKTKDSNWDEKVY